MAVSYLALLCKEELWDGQDSQNFIGGNLQRCGPGLHLLGRLNSEKPVRTRGERIRTQVSCPLAQACLDYLNSTPHSGQSCPLGVRSHAPPSGSGPAVQEPPFQILQVSPEQPKPENLSDQYSPALSAPLPLTVIKSGFESPDHRLLKV